MDKKKQTFSVLFWLRKGRGTENMAPLYCRVTITGQRYEIPTNIRIVTKYWNKDVQRSVGRTPADKEANLIIERTAQDVEETIRKIHQKGFELTMENFRMNYQAQENQYSTLTALFIIRKSKFPQNPKRSVRFSGKRTKRSVQKRKARNTQKAETKVL